MERLSITQPRGVGAWTGLQVYDIRQLGTSTLNSQLTHEIAAQPSLSDEETEAERLGDICSS